MNNPVIETCRLIVAPAVRLLIRAGFGWKDFAELGKRLFVDVARREYGLKGRPTNSARVAMMTGLSRREVGRIVATLSGAEEPSATRHSRISQVLTGWHVDPDFLDEDGLPALLAAGEAKGSLHALLKRYGGDIPPGALAKELLQLGLMTEESQGFSVTSRDYIRAASDPDMLRQGGVALHDHATTILHNVSVDRSEPARFERMATQLDVDPVDAAEFERYLQQRGQQFLEEMDRWLAARRQARTGPSGNRESVRTGVGMYLIYDETQGTKDNE